MAETITKSTCAYCGVGCGINIHYEDGIIVDVSGDQEHPANYGRLCVKGSSLHETVEHDGRMLFPSINDEQVSWDEALDHVADNFSRIIKEHGPDSVAFYLSGQILTEDYYVSNKLMKGFIGSANVDTNSRLCMASAVAGYKRAFGNDAVPCSYDDLALADLIVITGSNTAWAHPIIFQRITQAKKDNPNLKVVTIDPRRTATSEIADLHLSIMPGSDSFLFTGLLNYLAQNGQLDKEYIDQHTEGFEQALEKAICESGTVAQVADKCGVDEPDLLQLFQWFGSTEKVLTLFSQGINQSSSGVDKVNAIVNCHLATGRIGKEGMGPFSITGQPNAMGGREVGGLANQLAAHMDILNPVHRDRVSRFWNSSVIPSQMGLKAVDMFDAMAEGKIKAVWIMATNPMVSLPESDRVREALDNCELIVVSDCMAKTDTVDRAHVKLPATSWGEKNGMVTNSERCISRLRGSAIPPGVAKDDWWVMCEVGKRMGFSEAFDFSSAADVFREHAALSGFENSDEFETGRRAFDISALADMSDEEYENFTPAQWPITPQAPQGTARLFTDGRYFTASGKAQIIAVSPQYPQQSLNDEYPLYLNSGRVRDQWHTMTRTGSVAKLMNHRDEPYLEVHPSDAEKFGLTDGQLCEVNSLSGSAIVRTQINKGQRPGSVFMPIHWNDQFTAKGRVDALVKSITDPISGQPEFKHTPVTVKPCEFAYHGYFITRKPVELGDVDYWSMIKSDHSYRYEIAGYSKPDNWHEWVIKHVQPNLAVKVSQLDMIRFKDPSLGNYRDALVVGDTLHAVLFVSSQHSDYQHPSWHWVISLFQEKTLDLEDRKSLLSGIPSLPTEDVGPIVCACFKVGLNTIKDAIKEQGLSTVEQLGEVLECGTNCGSCIPELKQLLD